MDPEVSPFSGLLVTRLTVTVGTLARPDHEVRVQVTRVLLVPQTRPTPTTVLSVSPGGSSLVGVGLHP